MTPGLILAGLSLVTGAGTIATYYPKMQRNRATLRPRRRFTSYAATRPGYTKRFSMTKLMRLSSLSRHSQSRNSSNGKLFREEPLIVLAPAAASNRETHILLVSEPYIAVDHNSWAPPPDPIRTARAQKSQKAT